MGDRRLFASNAGVCLADAPAATRMTHLIGALLDSEIQKTSGGAHFEGVQ